MHMLEARNLSKTYASQVRAVNNLSLTLNPSEVLCLLGPNGAGKSTTIKLLLGQEQPDQGEVFFQGQPWKNEFRKRLGCTPQETDFPLNVTVEEILKLVGAHYENPMAIDECLERFYLTKIYKRRSHQLSGGQRRCLALACAFVGKPQLVLLDEPTTGLDVNTRQLLWKEIETHRSNGGSTLLSTHYLAEAEAIAQRIVMIHQGRVIKSGTVQDIQSSIGFRRVKYYEGTQLHSVICENSDDFLRDKVVEKNLKDFEVTPISLEEAFVHIMENQI